MNMTDPIYRALEIIAKAASASGAVWLVGGSAGLMLRGIELTNPPRDLDLYADERDARLLHAALREYAVDDQKLNVSGVYRSVLSHYRIEGVSVELVGGFVITSGLSQYRVEVTAVLAQHSLSLTIGGCPVGVVPLAHELWFNVLRNRNDRVSLIAAAVGAEPGPHREAFCAIESRNRLSEASVKHLHNLIANMEARGTS
ncbi:hypothetical protein KZ483_18840 [Paenibacillus sp. sptzw28]|uniref:hypothetical protein n=1 Tax=Paenibacillus sp. sptzw28 TaxID=715179 RepID=UPI001C6EC8AE|nr:hypothetical protein [Paenibacillus sp. sptzw28]QYR19919.1 hypothetical protein KZ483_18840 [Paenibacillus sp. sptzw28]